MESPLLPLEQHLRQIKKDLAQGQPRIHYHLPKDPLHYKE